MADPPPAAPVRPCSTTTSTSTCTASRPSALKNRGDDLAVIRLAHPYGISGWVLQSHLWLTTDRAALLAREARDLGFTVYGSITLNPPMGGVSATVVELAAAHGARVVFLPPGGRPPTWAATGTSRGCSASSRRPSPATPPRTPSGCSPRPGSCPASAARSSTLASASACRWRRARVAGGERGGRGVLRGRRPAAADHPPAALHARPGRAAGSLTSARSSSSPAPRSFTRTPTCPSATCTRRCPRSVPTG